MIFFGGKNAAYFIMQDFLTKFFPQIVWFLGYKVITLPPDTRNDEETTETTAAKRIHTQGNDGNGNVCCTRSLTYGIIVNKC